MAQARVTEYYSSRKRRRVDQPSKRRKVDFTETEASITQVDRGPLKHNLINAQIEPKTTLETFASKLQQRHRDTVSTTSVASSRRSTRSSSKNIENSTANTGTRKSSRAGNPNKNTIPDLFESLAVKSKTSEESIEKSALSNVYSETTESWDEHDGFSSNQESCCNTPQKTPAERKNVRKRKKDQEAAVNETLLLQSTPTQDSTSKPENKKETLAKKKLDLNLNSRPNYSAEDRTVSPITEESIITEPTKDKLLYLAAAMSPPKAISPLPGTPQKVVPSQRNKKTKPSSEKILAAIEQCKSLTRSTAKEPPLIDPAVVKARLAKCGKLEELKAQLSKMNSAKTRAKKPKGKEPIRVESPKLNKFDSIDIEVEETKTTEVKKVPAYERYHHLSTPGAPTLSLPYKYRVLAEMFRGMDTVVSMLHNRSEIITFSKLKAAVQTMNKRNFEKTNAGQIKNVFPTGYRYLQEKGLPCYGGKTPGYQLTIEPVLHEGEITLEEETVPVTKSKVTFSAAHLLKRRGFFHNRLIDIVKRYHKEFLSKLSTPLSIPDDKITRWHPQFKLDDVPEVNPSPLPEPPFVKKYHTAKDVLEASRGKTLPRVECALENVANQSEKTNGGQTVEKNQTNKQSSIKGVPQSLLEKIRAKEAAKLESTLTRNPVEEKKTLMMSRLPDMMRIIRNYFVTEKKSSLPMGSVVQKLQDSFRSTIALSDVEIHVKLMIELAPDWLTLQEIKKGKYLKLNTAMEVQTLQDKLKEMVKQRR